MIQKAMSIYINELVYDMKANDIDVITLSLGEAFFDLDKPQFDNYDTDELVHYTSSRGHPKLLETLKRYYGEVHGAKVDSGNIMVTAGSKIAIYMALLNSINESRVKVAIVEPAWLSYKEQVILAHGQPINFGIETELSTLAKSIDSSYSAVILNNPNNPRGIRYSMKELLNLIEVCMSLGVNVIVDEAYSEFVEASDDFPSSSRFVNDYPNLIVVSSLSKNMGMSGFRIGYVVSSKQVINEMITLNQHLITCAPTILQVFIADKFFDILSKTKKQIEYILVKRKEVLSYINDKDMTALSGDSTFYLMLQISADCDIFEFCMKLLLVDKISVVPGIAYGDSCAEYVRISVGTETSQRIFDAIEKIKFRITNGWQDDVSVEQLLSEYNLPLLQ